MDDLDTAVRLDSFSYVRLKRMSEDQQIAFLRGVLHGMWLYAYWKDGVQHVGTSGRTLEEAQGPFRVLLEALCGSPDEASDERP